MNITIKTLEITRAKKQVPLTAKIVKQFDFARGDVNVSRTGCHAVCRVSLPDENMVLISGLDGQLVRISSSNYLNSGWEKTFGSLESIPKIILL